MKQKKLTDFLLMTAVASAMLTGCGGSASEPSSAVTAYNASDSSMMKVADVSARGGIPGEMANTTTGKFKRGINEFRSRTETGAERIYSVRDN